MIPKEKAKQFIKLNIKKYYLNAMRKAIKKDAPIYPLIITPFVMLIIEWRNIPLIISIPWSITKGNNNLMSKNVLYITCLISLITYLILLIPQFMPIVKTKEKIMKKEEKYFNFKFAVVLFMMFFSWLTIWKCQINRFMFG